MRFRRITSALKALGGGGSVAKGSKRGRARQLSKRNKTHPPHPTPSTLSLGLPPPLPRYWFRSRLLRPPGARFLFERAESRPLFSCCSCNCKTGFRRAHGAAELQRAPDPPVKTGSSRYIKKARAAVVNQKRRPHLQKRERGERAWEGERDC